MVYSILTDVGVGQGKGSNKDICVTASSKLLALLLNDNVMLKLSLQSYLKVVSELWLLASSIHVVFSTC